MCYGMMNKRSSVAKKATESGHMTSGRMETRAAADETAAARNQSAESAYSGFMGRVQRWMKKGERKQEESVY